VVNTVLYATLMFPVARANWRGTIASTNGAWVAGGLLGKERIP
jgi:hypothetical protein